MKVLVLGYGSMGRRHAENALALNHEVSVYDPRLGAAQKDEQIPLHEPLEGVRYFNDRGEKKAWATKPDAVVIATPAAAHAEAFWRAAEAGVRVFVEKPLALTAEDFLRGRTPAQLRDATQDTVTAVGYNLRFHDGLQHGVGNHLPLAGDPLAARFYISCDMATWPGVSYADTLLECSHELDLALYLLGPATVEGAVSAAGGAVLEILLRHARGTATSVRLDGRFPGYRRGLEVTGTAGVWRWQWDARSGKTRTAFSPDGERATHRYDLTVTAEATYWEELKAWLDGTPGCPLADGVAVLRLCDAVHERIHGDQAIPSAK